MNKADPADEKTRRFDLDDHLIALAAGSVVGKYRLGAVLGQGGFGITYRAEDLELHRTVAIKEYLPADMAVRIDGITVKAKSRSDEEYFAWGLSRFLDEARTLARFRSASSVIQVYDYIEANGTAYLVMELIEGMSLAEAYRLEGTLPESRLKPMALALLDGLERVHEAGFLHRDIKPSNILLRADGNPVLIDFGAARQALGEKSRSITGIYTPGYAPFEQYMSGSGQGPWTDIYALAATLYHGVTGRVPPQATNRIRADDMVPAAMAGNRRYSRSFLGAIDRGLAVHEAARPQSVAQWRAMLVGDATSRPWYRDPRRLAPLAGGAVAMIGFGFGATMLLMPQSAPDDPAVLERELKSAEERAQRLADEARKASDEARERAQKLASAADEAKKRADEQAERQRAAEQAAKAQQEAEQARRQAEAARLKAEEEARQKAAEEAKRREEEVRQMADAQARQRAEEQARKLAEQEAERQRLAQEKADEERRQAEEARRKVEQELAEQRRLADAARAEAEERARQAEQARRDAEAEVKRLAEAEARRKADEAARQKAEEEAKKKAEADAKKKADEEAKKKAEAEAKKKADEEAKLKAQQQAAATAKPGDAPADVNRYIDANAAAIRAAIEENARATFAGAEQFRAGPIGARNVVSVREGRLVIELAFAGQSAGRPLGAMRARLNINGYPVLAEIAKIEWLASGGLQVASVAAAPDPARYAYEGSWSWRFSCPSGMTFNYGGAERISGPSFSWTFKRQASGTANGSIEGNRMNFSIRWLGPDGSENEGRFTLTDTGSGIFQGNGSVTGISGNRNRDSNCAITMARTGT